MVVFLIYHYSVMFDDVSNAIESRPTILLLDLISNLFRWESIDTCNFSERDLQPREGGRLGPLREDGRLGT